MSKEASGPEEGERGMANPEQVELLQQEIDHWNTWRAENPEIRPDLREADLRGAVLSEADLSRAVLRGADLSRAVLRGAVLSWADLSRADLRRAVLSEINLSWADLSRAILWGTVIAKSDLRTTKGLTTINHWGPSDIELFSVQLPQDGSALHFLRGVGVPDEWIDDYRARMMHPIQYHSCFLSYCSKDEMLAKRLHADLQAEGVRCWFAPEDLKIGDRIRQRIDEEIHLQDKLLLLLSEHSIASSWVRDEVEAAFEKERQQQRDVLFPIRLDETVMQTGESWAATLRRSRHIGDFSQGRAPRHIRPLLHDSCAT
ncbi:MAG TPA: toll/interleukin-1 receptor domain-containing protein [Ktedonobacteraceae bacterium]|nr:toll/interleukin-1 receptor domain-containing protein [Ktedonobacteraceae bacterium]